MLDYLKRLIEEGRILLSAKSIYPEIYEGNNYFMLTPIVGPDECVEVEGQNIQVCADPIEVIIHASKQSPILKFGNSSIRYPESYEGNPALRTSLQAMQGIIHVPVRRASDVTLNKEIGIVRLLSTTDPRAEHWYDRELKCDLALLDAAGNEITGNEGIITQMRMDPTQLGIVFREGFEYVLNIDINRSAMTGCSGNAILPIIVIPEYMTWTPQKGSFDWNDDANWSRSIASDAEIGRAHV